jgi:hypothetical protein
MVCGRLGGENETRNMGKLSEGPQGRDACDLWEYQGTYDVIEQTPVHSS